MLIVQLESFPIEQARDLEALEWQLGAWAAGRTYPWRLLAYSRPFDMRPVISGTQSKLRDLLPIAEAAGPIVQAVRARRAGQPGPHPADALAALAAEQRARLELLVRGLPPFARLLRTPAQAGDALWDSFAQALAGLLWPVPWLKEMARFYEALGERHLRSATFFLLIWDLPESQADTLLASLEHTTGRRASLCESLPPTLTAEYTVDERQARLVPQVPGQPYLAVLRSYDMNGTWDATTLHTLLALDFDVALALDVTTFSQGRVIKELELAKRTAESVLRDGKDDPVALRKLHQASEGMHRLDTESLHDLQIAVLVSADTPARLAANVATVRDRMGSTLRLDAVAGAQGELIKLWSARKAGEIDAPLRRYTVWSHGVGCALGLLGYHRASRTDGLCWGLDMLRRAPLFYDLFADDQAAHSVVLGKTGYGKSFFLNVVTLRAAAQLGYRVVAVDAFRNGARIAAAAGAGAICHWLGVHTPINVLDVVYDERDGDWRPLQVQHAIGQLSLVFGKPAQLRTGDEASETLVPYTFTDEEEGVLDRALGDLYAGVSPRAAPEAMPRLSDLIAELERIHEPEARQLARRLRIKLFGSSGGDRLTEIGKSLNVPSRVDWSFGYDINYFDFSEVPERLRSFYYAHLVGAFNRFMRDPQRDTGRRTLLLLDEFHYVTRVEAVARLAAEICKVARKYGIGLMPVDQNPSTFLDNSYGRQIFENAVAKFMFHLDDLPARRMADAIGDLTPEHVRFLAQAGRGRCLAAFGNDIYHMLVEASPQELRSLRGS